MIIINDYCLVPTTFQYKKVKSLLRYININDSLLYISIRVRYVLLCVPIIYIQLHILIFDFSVKSLLRRLSYPNWPSPKMCNSNQESLHTFVDDRTLYGYLFEINFNTKNISIKYVNKTLKKYIYFSGISFFYHQSQQTSRSTTELQITVYSYI